MCYSTKKKTVTKESSKVLIADNPNNYLANIAMTAYAHPKLKAGEASGEFRDRQRL
jgi:hypothetical protein